MSALHWLKVHPLNTDRAMTLRQATFVRSCRLWDVPQLSRMLRQSWHSTYDAMIDRETVRHVGRRFYARWELGWSLFVGGWSSLVAVQGNDVVGYALSTRDSRGDVVLYALYVAATAKGQGVGTALLNAVIAASPRANTIRLEVLQKNTAAIAWYERRGFEIFGETRNATGMLGVPAYYMDKALSHQGAVMQAAVPSAICRRPA